MVNKLKWNPPRSVSLSPQEETIRKAIHIICAEYEGNVTKFFEQTQSKELSQDAKSCTL